VINREGDRRFLASFINGLRGTPGKHVRMQMPDNVDKALSMAIVATNAEREEKALGREDRGTSARVFTVGGNRGMTQENRYEKPRGKFQWSGNRGAGSQSRTGSTQYSTRVNGTYSGCRTDIRTPWQTENVQTQGGGAKSVPKKDDDRCAPQGPRGIHCFNCGLAGHIRKNCRRGQGNLNGIGRTKTTPSSKPK